VLEHVREATVLGLAESYGADLDHARHVAFIADRIYSQLCKAGLQDDDPVEREWLWAASLLHDVGVLIDYHDHHKHSQYLVLNAGLPGFDHRELALIAALIRGHRKRLPGVGPYGGLVKKSDERRIDRLAVCLRLAEQLERGRSRAVTGVVAESDGTTLSLRITCESDPSVAIWAASQEQPIVQRAFGLALEIDYSTNLISAVSDAGGSGVPSSRI
jgi:exopolyphosphatase/guanosine-5'-triphosphate,3'-diphosphate pyrophosphatase